MSRADRRAWKDARTLTDLGELMARWLEGDIRSWPGYQPGYGPELESRPLIPAMAAANRAGYVTTCSQPGNVARGFDGRTWRQRAAVDGHVGDPQLLDRIRTAARRHRLTLVTHRGLGRGGGWESVTEADGEIITAFGGQLTRRDFGSVWPGLHRAASAALAASWQVTLVHDVWGPAGTAPLAGALMDVARAPAGRH